MPTQQVPDCSGYLETNINPYVKGLIGNYKPYRSYTYYGERAENINNLNTAIRKNGYFPDFSNYWFFNTANNLVPNIANTKWVWNSELTKVNAKGQELETRDALDRYTAAQYGFDKNMPVSVTQNARYGESFEDYGYTERINPVTNNVCNVPYIDFTTALNSSVAAHSGKNTMIVNPNSQIVKSIKVSDVIHDNYDFIMPGGSLITEIQTPTGNHQTLPPSIPLYPGATFNFSFGNLSMSYNATKNTSGGRPLFQYDLVTNTSRFFRYNQTTQNIKITNSNLYRFTLNAAQSYDFEWDGTASFDRAAIYMVIKKQDGTPVFSKSLWSDVESSSSENVFLNCGHYVITCYVSSDLVYPGNIAEMHIFHSYASYSSNISGATGFYNSCNFLKPIPTTDSMLNSSFALIPGKKMQFSAWVKEDCPILCTKTDYSLSKIELWAGGINIGASSPTNPVKRIGTIIEGWQKIEGEFTVPSNVSSAEIRFINSNTNAPMYVDDIRIHPYNANMKSYVYDARNLKLSAELDENNYASFYEYDEEGQLVRVKKETIQGIKTIQETRSSKQKVITDLQ